MALSTRESGASDPPGKCLWDETPASRDEAPAAPPRPNDSDASFRARVRRRIFEAVGGAVNDNMPNSEVLRLSPSRAVALAVACALFLALISAALVVALPSDASVSSAAWSEPAR